jgi:flagellar basal-body rod modification protein FlgD
MNVSTVTATAPATTNSKTAALQSGADFTTFLTLLTTQLRNQDPLKPLDSTDFVAQLASFSAVEQQVRTNALLESVATALGSTPVSGLATWIGVEVAAARPARFADRPIDLLVAPADGAETVSLVVRNAAGGSVGTEVLAPDASRITWAGTGPGGDPLSPGTYTFSVESYLDGDLIASTPASVYGTVAEARLEGGRTVLVFDDGTQTPADNVTAMRTPSAFP